MRPWVGGCSRRPRLVRLSAQHRLYRGAAERCRRVNCSWRRFSSNECRIMSWPSSRQSQRRTFPVKTERDDMTVKRMDNVGIVVESLDAVISFFSELGLKLEGRAT